MTNLTVVRDKRQVNITWKKPTERTGPTNYTLTVGTEIMNVEGNLFILPGNNRVKVS